MRETDYDKLDRITVTGVENYLPVLAWLGTQSCWFECDPLPNDQYHVYLKPEGHCARLIETLQDSDIPKEQRVLRNLDFHLQR